MYLQPNPGLQKYHQNPFATETVLNKVPSFIKQEQKQEEKPKGLALD